MPHKSHHLRLADTPRANQRTEKVPRIGVLPDISLDVVFVGEVVANRFCAVTVGHEAGYEVSVGHGNGAMITRRPAMIVFMFVVSNYICL